MALSAQERSTPDQLPTIGHVGRYALKYCIGEGGLGTVYAAHDPLLSRLRQEADAILRLEPELGGFRYSQSACKDNAASDTERLGLLRQGLAATTVITTPAALGLLLSAPAIVALLFPGVTGTERLAPLLGWYAAALVIAGWNALLARYCHARGDTRLPFLCDLGGSGLHALAMPLLAWGFGLMGLAAATLVGVGVTCALLLQLNGLWRQVHLPRIVLSAALPLALGGWLLHSLPAEPWLRLGLSTLAGAACLALVGLGLRPWRAV